LFKGQKNIIKRNDKFKQKLDKHPPTGFKLKRKNKKISIVFDHKEKKNIIKRLNYINGQIEGVEKMIEKGREYKEVFIQLKAVEGALNKLIYTVFAETLKKQLAEALSQRLMECPGNCELAEYLQFLRKEFGKLNIEEIIQAIDKLSVKQKRRQKP